jgi:hypothetical protein
MNMLNDWLPVESPVYGKGGVRLGGFYFFGPFLCITAALWPRRKELTALNNTSPFQFIFASSSGFVGSRL